MACALLSGALFLLAATAFAMPVSTTHAIVGAVLGMTAVGAGAACVKWGYPGVLSIGVSWCASPVMAGVLSAAMHVLLQKAIFQVCLHNALVVLLVTPCTQATSPLHHRRCSADIFSCTAQERNVMLLCASPLQSFTTTTRQNRTFLLLHAICNHQHAASRVSFVRVFTTGHTITHTADGYRLKIHTELH